MAEFINTVDILGDDALTDSIINRSITEYNDNAITQIGINTFNACSALLSVDFPVATSIGTNAFYGCSKLKTINFPLVTTIAAEAFYGCTLLTSVDFPVLTSIPDGAFRTSNGLRFANFPAVTSIATNALRGCSQLVALILRNASKVATLSGTNALTATSIAAGTGYIYVPRDLVDSYKSATNWSTYANQFRALEDYTVDGTIAGALDESKI
jgi:hypothetical protein